DVGAVTYQTASGDKLARKIESGHRLAGCQPHELFAPTKQKRVGDDEERTGTALSKDRKCCVYFLLTAGVEDGELQTERTCRAANGRHPNVGGWKVRVHQHRNHAGFRNEFVQQLYALCLQIGGEKAYTRHVAAWSVHAGDESARDRVVADDKHDRN